MLYAIQIQGDYSVFSLPILVLCIGACVALLVKPQTAVIVGCFAACLGSITMIPLFLLSRLGNGEFVLQTFFMLPLATPRRPLHPA